MLYQKSSGTSHERVVSELFKQWAVLIKMDKEVLNENVIVTDKEVVKEKVNMTGKDTVDSK